MSDPMDVLPQLEPLRAVPARSDAAARSGLQTFLAEAAQLHAVPAPDQARPTAWKSFFKPARPPRLLLAKIMLIVTLMAGGAGATTVAAQSSLPGDGLYPIKLLVEDARAALTADPQAQIDLHLELAQTRTQEMQHLIAQQRAVPDDTPVQLQTQLRAALQAAARLNEAPLRIALNQIETRITAQAQTLVQAQANAASDRGLRAAAQTLTQMQALAHLGLSDPAAFRARFGPGRPIDLPTPPAPATSQSPMPAYTLTVTHTLQPSRTPPPSPSPQATRAPDSTGTLQGNGYGPGSPAAPGQSATAQSVVTPVGNGQLQATPSGKGEPQATPSGNGPGPNPTPEPGGNGGGGPH